MKINFSITATLSRRNDNDARIDSDMLLFVCQNLKDRAERYLVDSGLQPEEIEGSAVVVIDGKEK